MKEYFEKAIQRIRSLKEIVSEKEWNDIAREENLLSSESIKYISQRDFNTLQKEVRASQSSSYKWKILVEKINTFLTHQYRIKQKCTEMKKQEKSVISIL